MKTKSLFLSTVVVSLFVAATANALVRPSQRHEAGGNKSGNYISDGFFVGGERTVTSAKLKDLRRAKSNEGYERIVLDLEPMGEDKNAMPYFQMQAAPNEGRIVLSIWADVMYDFDVAKVQKIFGKSAHIKSLNVLPRVEDGLTVVEFVLNPAVAKKSKFEVFRLARPSRIIMDMM
jgi:hypothetical protein